MTPPATASVSLREAFMAGLRGKTLGYAYATAAIRAYCRGISGRVLDIAGGKNPEYTRSFKHVELVRTNLNASEGVVAVDMNKPLPFPDNSFDAALLFAALYIAEHPTDLAREVKRILKAGGTWYIASPFLSNEMPEPHDYMRFTAEGLERLLREAGFEEIEVYRMGERAVAAANLMQPFFRFNVVRAFAFSAAVLLDRTVPERVRREHPAPLFYFVRCRKP
jgi:SAM-dependent methyltransferase